jgi:hypothetical protein
MVQEGSFYKHSSTSDAAEAWYFMPERRHADFNAETVEGGPRPASSWRTAARG